MTEATRHVDDEPAVVTVSGRPVAALVALSNVDAETISLSTNPKFLAILERGISSKEMRRRLGLKKS